ncbi:hypothetical protein ILYODFUR_036879 [Ilyodon furcidens]|uniref:Uncharacterized protein n=1 Tax=Ilyodon furcidens TaxID=33524 RepID=A0ABV0TFC2_9TELE
MKNERCPLWSLLSSFQTACRNSFSTGGFSATQFCFCGGFGETKVSNSYTLISPFMNENTGYTDSISFYLTLHMIGDRMTSLDPVEFYVFLPAKDIRTLGLS